MKYYILLLLAAAGFAGCSKQLNEVPLEKYTEDYVFDPRDSVGTNVEQVLNNIYSILPNGFNRVGGNFLDAATDDAISSQYNQAVEYIALSNINSAATHPDDAWNKNFTGIHKVNLFLKNAAIVPIPLKVPNWKAEARFLRSMFYFELIKRYGGVPLIGDSVYTYTDNLQLKRNSFAECVKYIVSECDSIKTLVKQEPLSTTDFGRISNGAVLSLKARVLLYAASPLYNGVVSQGSAVQKELAGYPTYDANRWALAAQAAKDVISLNKYSLDPTFNNIFINRRGNENILSYLRGTSNDVEVNNGPVGFRTGTTGNGITSPTQDLVEAFPMIDGTPVTASATYSLQNQYANRDPRLANTVLYNGVKWLNRNLEMFEGGLDKPNIGNLTQTRTGYYLRKFMGNLSTSTSITVQNHNFNIFRYAEILLDYAEAKNEMDGATTEVYQVLKDIRKRAGISAGTSSLYGLKSNMSKDEMRDAIKLERRLELAFEEHRYWDLRRWKDAEVVMNKKLSGLIITKDAIAGATTYKKLDVFQPVFDANKMYLYPIPFSELMKDRELIQNYGW
ncbi:RagB/SusD family nutrient uptake outer membrane protein [Pinibacter soli]|uniref:RagB/SusD family nutrient uptake outer membrane protein n=1 Tax=Pinibacter soli TaxID=3044211 RepID=A0ABT6R745_9BACT|nr:RagB/SusD family nutrient uptake outer membrane protein [Pinibacter soli]MDI3318380.1 RagB/SusD family nutrient uptake outer membrane protein [Pinibacter soli]